MADRSALLMQPHHVAMHLHTPPPTLPLQPLGARHRRRGRRVRHEHYGYRCSCRDVGGGFGRSPDRGQVPLDRVEDSSAAVLEQVPPVGDMDSIGRTAAAAIGVARTTVAGDHLDAGMGTQPGCKAVRLAVG